MPSTKTEALQRAIDYLGAVEVAPGFIALKGAYTGRWRVLALANVAPGYSPSAVAFLVSGVEMPAWWSPDRQYAWRIRLSDGALTGSRF